MNHNTLKKTELIVRKDNTIYGEYDYIDDLQLRLDIINGKIKEQLYYRNEHGGISEIDEFGYCKTYTPFSFIDKLLHNIIQSQCDKKQHLLNKI